MTKATHRSDGSTHTVVDEPPLPARTRRPMDGVWLVLVTASMAGLVALSIVAERTLTAITADLADLDSRLSDGPVEIVAFVANLIGLVLPLILVILLMVRGRNRTTIELLVAGLVSAAMAAVASAWLTGPAPAHLQESLVAGDDTAVPTNPALLVALVTVVSRLDVKRIRQFAIFSISGNFAVWLLRGDVTVGGMLVAIGIGSSVGLLVRLVWGQPSVAPSGSKVAAALAANGYDITVLRAEPAEDHRRFTAETADGPLTVLVLDRDGEGAGTIARTLDRLRTRDEVLPRHATTLRDTVDLITLQSLAVSRAGVRTPGLRTVLRVDANSTVLVYEHVTGTALADLTADMVTDATLDDLWRQLGQLRRNHVAHRRLSGRSILVDEDGHSWLLDPSGGEVAAGDLPLRTDLAQALVACTLAVGVTRTVESSLRVLGPEIVATAVPLLQPVALSRSTRHVVRQHRDLLTDLRDQLVRQLGQEPGEPARLQRIRPLSLLTGVGTVAAVYLIGTQLADLSVRELWEQTDLTWLILALALMFTTYVGMAMGVLGFVPERIPFWRAVAAQASLGFLRLVTPANVGNVTINIRLLTKAGVAAPLAAASVAAHQVGQVAVTFPLVAILAVVSGSSVLAELRPSTSTLTIVLGVLLVIALIVLVPPVRARLRAVWTEFAERGLPRLFDVLSDPRKLALAISGYLIQTVSLVLCFYACLRAVGGHADIAAIGVVHIVGNTLGTAVPTPGGLGAVEAALSAGITALGVTSTTAVTAVLLFRIVSFWLPIIPGWIFWTQMQKRGLL